MPMRIVRGELRLLLVTSRETGKWVVPKGWPMRGLRPHKTALCEAFEEAGIRGRMRKKPVGSYRYWKRLDTTFELIEVRVYPMLVTDELSTWPERDQRRRMWFDPFTAADTALEPELSTLILRAAADRKTMAFLHKGTAFAEADVA